QRNLASLAPPAALSELDEIARRADEHTACGVCGLDCRLDDHPAQLVDVMRGAENVSEPGDRVAEAFALGVQLVEPRLQLAGHLVERLAQQGELVSPVLRNALGQMAASDRASCIDEPPDRADDGTALEVCDRRDEDERPEQAHQELP